MAKLDLQLNCARDATDKALASGNACDWDVALECWLNLQQSVNSVAERALVITRGLKAQSEWGRDGEGRG